MEILKKILKNYFNFMTYDNLFLKFDTHEIIKKRVSTVDPLKLLRFDTHITAFTFLKIYIFRLKLSDTLLKISSTEIYFKYVCLQQHWYMFSIPCTCCSP